MGVFRSLWRTLLSTHHKGDFSESPIPLRQNPLCPELSKRKILGGGSEYCIRLLPSASVFRPNMPRLSTDVRRGWRMCSGRISDAPPWFLPFNGLSLFADTSHPLPNRAADVHGRLWKLTEAAPIMMKTEKNRPNRRNPGRGGRNIASVG